MASTSDVRRPPIIFDGSDQSFSFADFLRRVGWSSDWIALIASVGHQDMESMVPSRLYGDALRYYESLDLECQQDYEQLRNALSRRFPGAVRSGGLVQHPTTHWDQSGLRTPADAPPLTTLPPTGLVDRVNLDAKPAGPKVPVYLNNIRNIIKVPPFLFGLKSITPVRLIPPLTAHSLIIERAQGGTRWDISHTTIVTTLDLSDKAAVANAKKTPLAVVPANQAVNYRVGFVYTVHNGEHELDFRHDVLAPKQSKLLFSTGLGNRSVSPEGARTEARPISDFLSGWDYQVHPGTYVTKSSIQFWNSRSYNWKERKETKAVTWKIQLV